MVVCECGVREASRIARAHTLFNDNTRNVPTIGRGEQRRKENRRRRQRATNDNGHSSGRSELISSRVSLQRLRCEQNWVCTIFLPSVYGFLANKKSVETEAQRSRGTPNSMKCNAHVYGRLREHLPQLKSREHTLFRFPCDTWLNDRRARETTIGGGARVECRKKLKKESRHTE